ncbi:DUF7144 family membrane protein [Jiangella alba]|uniref:DUF7144 domain-containing protein n=1 Tax=Jiangella alba TaxID=561176 RepID=A0A1H5MN35_9ACTN|nr:hypothetical protein [Jiangella alba]SEE90041.1 hypothetical protein SAMN04488561_3254 [Jiangella alba]
MADIRSTADDEPRAAAATARDKAVPAAVLLMLAGAFQALQGVAAIADDDVFSARPGYAYDLDVTAWGWGHLIIGAILVVAGLFLFSGSAIAGGVAMALAGMSAIANFAFLPNYPFWTLLIIALDIVVIWFIASSGILES